MQSQGDALGLGKTARWASRLIAFTQGDRHRGPPLQKNLYRDVVIGGLVPVLARAPPARDEFSLTILSTHLGILRFKHPPNGIYPRFVRRQQGSSIFQALQDRQRPQKHCSASLRFKRC